MLQKGKYEYVLDTACVQFEPDDPEFIRVSERIRFLVISIGIGYGNGVSL